MRISNFSGLAPVDCDLSVIRQMGKLIKDRTQEKAQIRNLFFFYDDAADYDIDYEKIRMYHLARVTNNLDIGTTSEFTAETPQEYWIYKYIQESYGNIGVFQLTLDKNNKPTIKTITKTLPYKIDELYVMTERDFRTFKFSKDEAVEAMILNKMLDKYLLIIVGEIIEITKDRAFLINKDFEKTHGRG